MLRDPTATGQLVAVYSGSKLKKVVSHPDKPFYIHYIDDAKSVSVGMLINKTFAAAPCSCCQLVSEATQAPIHQGLLFCCPVSG